MDNEVVDLEKHLTFMENTGVGIDSYILDSKIVNALVKEPEKVFLQISGDYRARSYGPTNKFTLVCNSKEDYKKVSKALSPHKSWLKSIANLMSIVPTNTKAYTYSISEANISYLYMRHKYNLKQTNRDLPELIKSKLKQKNRGIGFINIPTTISVICVPDNSYLENLEANQPYVVNEFRNYFKTLPRQNNRLNIYLPEEKLTKKIKKNLRNNKIKLIDLPVIAPVFLAVQAYEYVAGMDTIATPYFVALWTGILMKDILYVKKHRAYNKEIGKHVELKTIENVLQTEQDII